MRKGKDPEPDPYLWLMDPDPVGPKTCGSCVSGSPTLLATKYFSSFSIWIAWNKKRNTLTDPGCVGTSARLRHLLSTWKNKIKKNFFCGVADPDPNPDPDPPDPDSPDPHVFGPDPDPDPSIIKQMKLEKPWYLLFCHFFLPFYHWKWCKSTFKKYCNMQKNFVLNYFFVGILKVNYENRRIRIH